MKKIISFKYKYAVATLLVAGLFFQALPVLAAASFNNDPSDYPTFKVGNSTTQQDTLNWSSSVSANAGEIVAFLIYYHNTSSETATQTKVRIVLPSGSFTSANATAAVYASNASPANGQVSINLTSSQSLTLIPSTIRWYPTGSSLSPQTLPYGQSGSEIISSGGLNLGDIAPGWGTQGYLTLKAQVSNSGGGQGQAPSVTTYSAYNIGQTYGTLSGNANPNNLNTTTWFEYGTTQSLGSQTSAQSLSASGNSSSISAYLSGLQQNATYYFRAVAQNSSGTSYGSILNFTTNASQQQYSGQAPIVYTNSATNVVQNNATLNGSVNSNSSNTTVWFEYGNSYSLGSTTGYQTVGSGNYSNNINAYLFGLSPNTVYYFRAVAQNSNGTSYGNILSFTTNNSVQNIQSGGLPSVSTSYASSISQNSAMLNGSVNSNNDSANAWFEWGRTLSLGNITYSQGINQNTGSFQISSNLSGLNSGTLYYFRAVARNSYGTAYGDIYNFRTQGGAVVTYVQPAVQQVITKPTVTYSSSNTTVDTCGSSASSIVLTPSINSLNPGKGEEITFTVNYRNGGQSEIKNAVLKIFLPQEVDYITSNRELFLSGNNLEYNLGTISAYGQGNVSVKANIKDSVSAGTNLVFNSLLNYTDNKDKQQQISTSLTVSTGDVKDSGQFLASLIGLFGYLFNSWLFNLLLIIAIIVAAYYFYRLFIKSNKNEGEKDDLLID